MLTAEEHAFDPTLIDCISFEDISSPMLRHGVEQWNGLRGRRRFPAREDLKPRDIVHLLSCMSLLRTLPDGDFEYRITGDAVVRSYDVRLQNRRVSDICRDMPVYARFVRPLLAHVARHGTPLAVKGKTGHDVYLTKFTHHENVVLPLGPNDDTVDHILIFSSYERRAL